MKTFWYILTVDTPFNETELPRVKAEIGRLLECTEISVSGGRHFTVQSKVSPSELESHAAELSRKFAARFTAGGRMD